MDDFMQIIGGLLVAGVCWMINSQVRLNRENHDLYDWHKPDNSGAQEWKNPKMAIMMEKFADGLLQVNATMSALLQEMKTQRKVDEARRGRSASDTEEFKK